MRCSAFRRRVVAFADGELPEETAQRMAEHALSCPGCAAELQVVRQEGARYGAAFWRHRAPAELTERVMAAVAEAEPAPENLARLPISPWWRYSVVGAAAVLLLAWVGLAAQGWLRPSAPKTAPAPQVYWAQAQAVQAEQATPGPSGGYRYDYQSKHGSERARRAEPKALIAASYSAPPISQAEPSFELEEMGPAGAPSPEEMKARRSSLGAPRALTARDQQLLNERAFQAGLGAGPPGTPAAVDQMDHMYGPRGERPAPGGVIEATGGAPPSTPSPAFPPVSVDSTDATVVLTVGYRQDEDRYVTTYNAAFEAKYTIRAPDVDRKGLRIAVSFPFPNGCSTVTGPKLLVDGAEDESHTSYSIAGLRWVGWFQPKESKAIAIAYTARGEGSYLYALDKNRLAKKFRLAMKVVGLEPGHEPELPSESLQPGPESRHTVEGWEYVWDHDGLLTTKDIIVNFPAKESPTALAERVNRNATKLLPVARFAPLLLVVYLGALLLTGLPRTDRRYLVETLALLGLAFLAFYPLFIFLSAYLGQGPALSCALAVTVGLSAVYSLLAGGASLAGRVVLLQAVLLGVVSYAILDPAVTGLLITVAVLVLLTYFLLTRATRWRAVA